MNRRRDKGRPANALAYNELVPLAVLDGLSRILVLLLVVLLLHGVGARGTELGGRKDADEFSFCSTAPNRANIATQLPLGDVSSLLRDAGGAALLPRFNKELELSLYSSLEYNCIVV